MNDAERQFILDSFVEWYRIGSQLADFDEYVELTTPFLDRHNDFVQVYVRQFAGGFEVTDDGYALSDLRSGGVDPAAGTRGEMVTAILRGLNITQTRGERLTATTTRTDLGQRVNDVVQAVLAVTGLHVLARIEPRASAQSPGEEQSQTPPLQDDTLRPE